MRIGEMACDVNGVTAYVVAVHDDARLLWSEDGKLWYDAGGERCSHIGESIVSLPDDDAPDTEWTEWQQAVLRDARECGWPY